MRFVPEGFAPSAGARGAAPEPARRGAGDSGGLWGGPGGCWGGSAGPVPSRPVLAFAPLLGSFGSPPRAARLAAAGGAPGLRRSLLRGRSLGAGGETAGAEGPEGERGDGGERPRCCRARGGPAGLGAEAGAAPPGRRAGRGGGTAASPSPALPERFPRGAGEPVLPSFPGSIPPRLHPSLPPCFPPERLRRRSCCRCPGGGRGRRRRGRGARRGAAGGGRRPGAAGRGGDAREAAAGGLG